MEAKTLYQVELRSIGVIQGDLNALEEIRELLLDSALHCSNMVGFCAERKDQAGVRCFQGLHDKRIEDYQTLSDLFNVTTQARPEDIMKVKTSSVYGTTAKEEP